MKQNKKLIRITAIILAVVVVLTGSVFIYLGTYYKAADVDAYMSGSSTVNVTKTDYGYFFDGSGSDDAFIFYPGAKVDEKAYAPILFQLASDGIDCFLVSMPFHMAIFDVNKADEIIDKYDYSNWYIGGHSMGGAMAAQYVANHKDNNTFKGLVFWAAYSAKDISDTHIPVLSLYGDKDGVLNMDKVESGRNLVDSDRYSEVVIEGGNHAGFASYGRQKGDNDASITKDEQWNQASRAIVEFIKR